MNKVCARCGAENPDQAKACVGCGGGQFKLVAAPGPAPLVVPCPACRRLNKPGAKQCAKCGTSLLGIDALTAPMPLPAVAAASPEPDADRQVGEAVDLPDWARAAATPARSPMWVAAPMVAIVVAGGGGMGLLQPRCARAGSGCDRIAGSGGGSRRRDAQTGRFDAHRWRERGRSSCTARRASGPGCACGQACRRWRDTVGARAAAHTGAGPTRARGAGTRCSTGAATSCRARTLTTRRRSGCATCNGASCGDEARCGIDAGRSARCTATDSAGCLLGQQHLHQAAVSRERMSQASQCRRPDLCSSQGTPGQRQSRHRTLTRSGL